MSRVVRIGVASAARVAERWKVQYFHEATGWKTIERSRPEEVYNKLCALGPEPTTDAVAEVIGNRSWTDIRCDACNDYVVRAARVNDVALCRLCLTDMIRALMGNP